MINRKLRARNEYKCDSCGKIDIWQRGWRHYGSLLIEENEPDALIHVCSKKCQFVAYSNLKCGIWVMPEWHARGYYASCFSGYGKYATKEATTQ